MNKAEIFLRGVVLSTTLGGLVSCGGIKASDTLTTKSCQAMNANFRAPRSWDLKEDNISTPTPGIFCEIAEQSITNDRPYGVYLLVAEFRNSQPLNPSAQSDRIDTPTWDGYKGYREGQEVDVFYKPLYPYREYIKELHNKNTKTLYILEFRAPQYEWDQYSELGSTMIDTASLDETR